MPYARKDKQRVTALKRVASAIKLAIEGAGQDEERSPSACGSAADAADPEAEQNLAVIPVDYIDHHGSDLIEVGSRNGARIPR